MVARQPKPFTPKHAMESRLEMLESKLAHLELAFDELNQVVYSQALKLDKLQAESQKLQGRLKEVVEDMQSQPFSAEDERPPHY